jgi:hypothetical protein
MYTPSRHYLDFHIAGFAYWEGLEVIEELKIGSELSLVAEPDNPYDNEAVAICYKGKKLGYVPKDKNSEISKFLFFGYGEFFESYINRVSPDQHPERQFGVVIKLKDIRKY